MHPVSVEPVSQDKPTRLAVYRHSFGISQQALSQRSGIPRSSIANYETRVTEPGTEVAERLAAALGLSVAEVFPHQGDHAEN